MYVYSSGHYLIVAHIQLDVGSLLYHLDFFMCTSKHISRNIGMLCNSGWFTSRHYYETCKDDSSVSSGW